MVEEKRPCPICGSSDRIIAAKNGQAYILCRECDYAIAVT